MFIRRHRITIEIEQRTFRVEQTGPAADEPGQPDDVSAASAPPTAGPILDAEPVVKPVLPLPKKP